MAECPGKTVLFLLPLLSPTVRLRKESGREFLRVFSVPEALSRATNVTGLSRAATVSDGALGYCVIYNFIRLRPAVRGKAEKKAEIR